MLYLNEAIIGLMFGVLLYLFVFLINSIREKFNKPLNYLEILIIPITSVFFVKMEGLISQYLITRTERFMGVTLLAVMIISTIVLLNKFVYEISVENIAKTKSLSKNRRLLLIAKWVSAITFLCSYTIVIFWVFFS